MYTEMATSQAEPVSENRKGPVTTKRKEGEGQQFVEFLLGNENFAINLFHTREVITPSAITPLPDSTPYINGVMDLRGQITTIIDLKKMMKITTESRGKQRSRIIILDTEISKKPVGILVDDVYSVSTYASGDIVRSEDDGAHNAQSILGVIRRKGRDGGKEEHSLILWLDIRAMITKIADEI